MDLVASSAPPGINFGYAIAHSQLGNVDAALDHVERMVQERTGGCTFLSVDHGLALLHGHPRFQAILTRAGLPLRRTASAPRTAST